VDELLDAMGAVELRSEIQQAWKRAALNGLDPGAAVAETELADVDPRSRLMLAARPVLDDFADQLAGTPYCVMLADREARIIDRRCGQVGLNALLDRVLAVPGHAYREENTGTNALATAFELRRGLSVTGEEHFLESMKDFSCYAQPIFHPLTRRLEGLLDITGYAASATPMFQPYLAWAVRAIEQRLELGAGLVQRQMLQAFQERSARSRNPLIVFGDDLTLTNSAASDRFDPAAQLVLREAALEAGEGRLHVAEIAPGKEIQLRCDRIEGTSAVLVEVLTAGARPPGDRKTRAPAGRRHEAELVTWRRNSTRVLICGEPGSGRTHAAYGMAGDRGVERVDALELSPGRLDLFERSAAELVVVEHIHLLEPAAALRLAKSLDTTTRWFALTCADPADLDGEQRSLAARCPAQLQLTPLRARRSELPQIAQAMLADIRPGANLRLSAAALRRLLAWDWPGNLRELRTVLEAAASRRSAGDLLDTDLPIANRPASGRARTPLKQAELDTIRAALERAGGNKSHVAAELGIGRTTLYRRLRELGIQG
jgi:transcriptional regulator of acetoin/glycerol metabolism